MQRGRLLTAAMILSVAFLACLFLIADFGRVRLRAASENLQATMARRVLIGELRRHIAEAGLASRSYLLTGDTAQLGAVSQAGQIVNSAGDEFVASYRNEDPRIAASARRLSYLAGVQIGEMTAAIALRRERGLEPAAALVAAQEERMRTTQQFQRVAQAIQQFEIARLRGDRARWRQELARARTLAWIGMLVNIILVVSATLLAAATLRRHREAMHQVARRRDELERDATERAAELNRLYGDLQTVQEQERSRLARGLHDDLGGLLLAARMDMTWLQHNWGTGDADSQRRRLGRVLEVLDQGIDLKRRVVEELRPTLLDNMGFIAALRWQMEETCGRGGVKCHGHFPAVEPELNPRAAIALFRVVQEALVNVQKHAAAREVNVTLDVTPTHVVLVIQDDGGGITEADLLKARSHGLAGMKHRIGALGGTLAIARGPGGGTEVRAAVPRADALVPQAAEPASADVIDAPQHDVKSGDAG